MDYGSVQQPKTDGSLTNGGVATATVNGKSSVPAPTVEPIKVEIPASQEGLNQLLRRYRELDMSNTHENEKLGILNALKKINYQQQKFDADIINERSMWKKNNEQVDLDLLKTQISSLQLLSKDIDLPLEFQLSLDKDGIDKLTADCKSKEEKLNHENSKTEEQISIPLDDYERKASLLGIQASKSEANPEFDSVGTSYAEQQLLAKLQMRLNELEQLPSNIGLYNADITDNDLKHSNDEVINDVDDVKIKGLVELKALRLLPYQKSVRNQLIRKIAADIVYNDPNLCQYDVFRMWKRSFCIRPKQKVAQTARLAEKLQEQQKKEKHEMLRRKRWSRLQGLIGIINDARTEVTQRKNLRLQLGKSVNHFHQQADREESRRKEKYAKQRLQALKSNDEEAYIKLLDETKDQRITHLLRQTNSFLGSLATAVKVQQHETSTMEKIDKGEDASVEAPKEEEKIDENTDYYEVAHHIKEQVTKQPDLLVGGKLKDYQLKGLEWMVSLYNNHLNGILADEMGLGKTIQSIALVTYLIEKKHETGKFLIIVPLSTITNWTLEFNRWAPSIKKIVYKGSQPQRKAMSYDIRAGDFTVLLTTYEYVIRDRPMLAKFHWADMIIDEGHRLKNTHSKLFKTLTQYYRTRNRLILTGTPLQNSLPELWALLNFILPKVFNSVKSFDEWFNTPFENTGHQEKLALSEEESLLIIRRLHKVLRPFLLRRLKKDVEKDLPDKVEKVIKCKLSALQSCVYKQLLEHNALFVGGPQTKGHKTGLRGLNNKVMQLRKICNHPFVFEEVEDAVNPSHLTTDLIWRSSGKFELLDRILPKLKATEHRTLMFFQMTQVMDIMEDFLRLRGIKYLRLDGSTKADDRQTMLKEFNAPHSEFFCFLLSTRAGGLGLNLQTADTVVIFDTDWNPHQDLQAQDRAHRIGQKHEVRIYRLITEDSVEEGILQRAQQKLDIDGKVIQAGKFDNRSSSEEQEAFLRRMIENEKKNSSESDTDEMNNDELNEILARNDDEKALFEKMDVKMNEEEKKRHLPRLMSDSELPAIFKKDMNKALEKKPVELGRRRHLKKVIYDDGLTEEQWLQAIDNENDSVEAAALRKRESLKKRRRRKAERSSSAEPDTEDDAYDGDNSADYTDGPSRKRRRGGSRSRSTSRLRELTPEESSFSDSPYTEPDEEPFVTLGLQLVKELKDLKNDNGQSISELFLTLPSKKLYPDYYQIIPEPVALREIKNKLKKGRYTDYSEFKHALLTMYKNAQTYNQEGSFVYENSIIMQKFSDSKLKIIEQKLGISGNEEPKKESNSVKTEGA